MQAAVMSLPSALKRKSVDAGQATSAQLKRSRVSFDPHTHVRPLTDTVLHEKPLSLVREDVWRALERHQHGDDREYNRLKHILQKSNDPEDDSTIPNTLLQKYFVALTSHSHMIGRNCGGLVSAALECDWLQRDEHFFLDFQQFITTFLASQSSYVPMALSWMMQKFSNVPKKPLRIENLPLVTHDQVLDRLHQTLDYVMQIIPTAVGVLENVIDNSFPFDLQDPQVYVEFVSNLMRLTKYTKAIEPKALRLIIEKLVAIDVQLNVDLDDLDKEDVEELVSQAREAESLPKDGEDGQQEDDEMEDQEDLAARKLKITRASIIKLDKLLNLLFARYSSIISNEPGRADTAFEQLVATFTRSILTSYNSRHCQYLLFRFCQHNAAMLQNFTASLLQIAFDRSRAIAIRSSAVSYLASLAARGSKISREAVLDLFNRLFAELDALRAGYEATAKGPDPERYRFYYTAFQACMYLFVFRWRDFVVPSDSSCAAGPGAGDGADDDTAEGAGAAGAAPHDGGAGADTRWLPGVREAFSEHVHGRVNPLKVCAPELVAMFARVAKALGLLYLYPKLATNRRVRLTRAAPPAGSLARETALSGCRDEAGLRLEGHYAFEPYLLPTSKRWLEGLYVNFEDIAPPGMLDESSDEED